MKRVLAIAVVMLLLAAGIAFGAGYEVKQKAGDNSVVVKFDKNPPSAGVNNLEIEIRDAAGNYVTDAKVRVDYMMPAMPGMPAMNYKSNATLSGNKYTAQINIPMACSWNVAVRITKDGKTTAAKFNLDLN